MALQLALISDSITRYGEALFTLVNDAGTFGISDDGVIARDEHTFEFPFEGGRLIAPIRSKLRDEGVTTATDRAWQLGEFVATRDYEFNGTTYPKGKRVLFAY